MGPHQVLRRRRSLTHVRAQIPFSGGGQTLSGRAPRPKTEAKAAKPESKPRRLDGRAVPDVIEIDSD